MRTKVRHQTLIGKKSDSAEPHDKASKNKQWGVELRLKVFPRHVNNIRSRKKASFILVLLPLFLGPRLHREGVDGFHFLLQGGVDQLVAVFERDSVEPV